ncbi:hypothetical protein [Nocardioides pantholopis]|uniref:hypothetical protein n=1 Tax=Nocardioides pantholopis TaxID=2483798 RepID=UPI0013DDE632|nr:hypothetical protein [Nocardioides pantholopis]
MAIRAHLFDMDEPTTTCKLCGNPLPPRTGRGRPRIYCSDRCRHLAHEERIQDPYLLGRFMDDLLCRIAVDHILENQAYQHAVNQLGVTFFMIGRMSQGSFQLPIVE